MLKTYDELKRKGGNLNTGSAILSSYFFHSCKISFASDFVYLIWLCKGQT